ncbi:proline-rich protein 36-like, partial [Podarcis raffonei]|uniref:proline-rich protein 36-like n=1 Tax=Podarcis raffonei TaxID=65483 RepID=UPI0023297702
TGALAGCCSSVVVVAGAVRLKRAHPGQAEAPAGLESGGWNAPGRPSPGLHAAASAPPPPPPPSPPPPRSRPAAGWGLEARPLLGPARSRPEEGAAAAAASPAPAAAPAPAAPSAEEGSAAVLPPLLRARCCCCCRRLRARRRCALTPRKQQRQQRAPCSAQAPSSLPASSSAANRRPPQRRPLRRARQSPGTWPAPASQSPHQPPAPAKSQRSLQGKAGRRGGRLPADTAWPRPPSRGRGVPTRAAASSARAPPPRRPTCLLGSPVAPLVRPIALFPPAQVPICFSHPPLDVSGAGAPSLLASAAPRASPRGFPRGEEKRLDEVYLARLRPSPAPQILPLLFPSLFLALSHNGLAVTLVGHQQHPPPPLPFERLFLCCIQSPREIFHIQVTGSTCQSPSTRSRPHRPEPLCFLPIYFAQKFLG